jgi:hypothetical protein
MIMSSRSKTPAKRKKDDGQRKRYQSVITEPLEVNGNNSIETYQEPVSHAIPRIQNRANKDILSVLDSQLQVKPKIVKYQTSIADTQEFQTTLDRILENAEKGVFEKK